MTDEQQVYQLHNLEIVAQLTVTNRRTVHQSFIRIEFKSTHH